MNNSLKAFIISFLIHVSLFAVILNYETPKPEKKEIIVLNMNMVQNITQAKKQEVQEEITKVEEKIEEKVIESEPTKELLPKKEVVKKIEKVINKQKDEPKKELPKKIIEKIEEKKEFQEVVEKIQDKEEVKITENIKPEPNYQQKYIDDNLASIIAAIKKHKKYPYQAKKQGMIGKVVIQCTITSNGIIQNIKIIEASKYELLNKNSIEILEIASKEFVSPKRDVTISIPFNYFLD